MAYRPVIGLLANSLIHSDFSLSQSCRWTFTMVVVSVAGLSSVAPFAISSALSFLSMPMCPRTHGTSILPLCSRLGRSSPFPRISAIFVGSILAFLSLSHRPRTCCRRKDTIFDCFLFNSGVSCWNSIAVFSRHYFRSGWCRLKSPAIMVGQVSGRFSSFISWPAECAPTLPVGGLNMFRMSIGRGLSIYRILARR